MRAMRTGETFETERLLEPGEAVAAYLAAAQPRPTGVEHVPLEAAIGRILAEDLPAESYVPADDRSTMDGFAVRAADGLAPRRIVGAVRMGHAPPGPLGPGEAMRIPTGGVMPPGADAVVPVEDALEGDGAVTPTELPEAGAFFTRRGDDMQPGALVLRAGRRIGAAELSVLATLGRTAVPVYRRPRVAIVSTGDELVDASERPGTGQVRDSNRWAIAGGLAALGCDALHLARAGDELADTVARIVEGLERADAVVLTGGSSVGQRDQVPAAIDELGAPGVVVHGLRVKPGKPAVLAAIGAKPVIGRLSRSAGAKAGRGTSRRWSRPTARGRSCFDPHTRACWRGPTATSSSGRIRGASRPARRFGSSVSWGRCDAPRVAGLGRAGARPGRVQLLDGSPPRAVREPRAGDGPHGRPPPRRRESEADRG
ncbi:MAG: molybdopterin molybdotransferase MoeA [Vulcanimicrobiaceae bacterium]